MMIYIRNKLHYSGKNPSFMENTIFKFDLAF